MSAGRKSGGACLGTSRRPPPGSVSGVSLKRASRWGLAGLRQLKLIAAASERRIQVESLGLLLLFKQKPELGRRWLNSNEDSKKFLGETQPQFACFLRMQTRMFNALPIVFSADRELRRDRNP